MQVNFLDCAFRLSTSRVKRDCRFGQVNLPPFTTQSRKGCREMHRELAALEEPLSTFKSGCWGS